MGSSIVSWLQGNMSIGWVVVAVGVLTVIGTLDDLAEKVVALTASQSDDQVLIKIENNFIVKFILALAKPFSIASKTVLISSSGTAISPSAQVVQAAPAAAAPSAQAAPASSSQT